MKGVDIWIALLIVWTCVLVAWTETLGQRHLRMRWIIETEVRRRMRRMRRAQPSNVTLRGTYVTPTADQVERWLRDGAR